MRIKTLNRTSLPPGAPDIEVFGDPNAWQLLCKASCIEEGWMKSTKAMEIPGGGCLIQVTTQQIGRDGVHAVAEAVVAIPGVKVADTIDKEGNVVGRRLVRVDSAIDEDTESLPDLPGAQGEGISQVVRLTREGLINANKTFGSVKFGKPSERKKIKPVGKKKPAAKKASRVKTRPSKS